MPKLSSSNSWVLLLALLPKTLFKFFAVVGKYLLDLEWETLFTNFKNSLASLAVLDSLTILVALSIATKRYLRLFSSGTGT